MSLFKIIANAEGSGVIELINIEDIKGFRLENLTKLTIYWKFGMSPRLDETESVYHVTEARGKYIHIKLTEALEKLEGKCSS